MRSAAFQVDAQLGDTDGSETLSLVITDLPLGATLTDGIREFVGSVGNTTVDISDWRHNTLRITPPADSDQDFVLTVTATAVENGSGDAALLTNTFDVQVIAVADQPLLSVPAELILSEDESASFAIAANLQDIDGSETLAVLLSGLPEGATLGDGTQTYTATSGGDTIDVTTWDLAAWKSHWRNTATWTLSWPCRSRRLRVPTWIKRWPGKRSEAALPPWRTLPY